MKIIERLSKLSNRQKLAIAIALAVGTVAGIGSLLLFPPATPEPPPPAPDPTFLVEAYICSYRQGDFIQACDIAREIPLAEAASLATLASKTKCDLKVDLPSVVEQLEALSTSTTPAVAEFAKEELARWKRELEAARSLIRFIREDDLGAYAETRARYPKSLFVELTKSDYEDRARRFAQTEAEKLQKRVDEAVEYLRGPADRITVEGLSRILQDWRQIAELARSVAQLCGPNDLLTIVESRCQELVVDAEVVDRAIQRRTTDKDLRALADSQSPYAQVARCLIEQEKELASQRQAEAAYQKAMRECDEAFERGDLTRALKVLETHPNTERQRRIQAIIAMFQQAEKALTARDYAGVRRALTLDKPEWVGRRGKEFLSRAESLRASEVAHLKQMKTLKSFERFQAIATPDELAQYQKEFTEDMLSEVRARLFQGKSDPADLELLELMSRAAAEPLKGKAARLKQSFSGSKK